MATVRTGEDGGVRRGPVDVVRRGRGEASLPLQGMEHRRARLPLGGMRVLRSDTHVPRASTFLRGKLSGINSVAGVLASAPTPVAVPWYRRGTAVVHHPKSRRNPHGKLPKHAISTENHKILETAVISPFPAWPLLQNTEYFGKVPAPGPVQKPKSYLPRPTSVVHPPDRPA